MSRTILYTDVAFPATLKHLAQLQQLLSRIPIPFPGRRLKKTKINKHTFGFPLLLPPAPPKVQVYSRNPGTRGLSNKLICHVSGFHPPDISIQLLENGEEMPGATQTDLAFEQSWQFHLTRSVPFTPTEDRQYSCRVKHGSDPEKDYTWGEREPPRLSRACPSPSLFFYFSVFIYWSCNPQRQLSF